MSGQVRTVDWEGGVSDAWDAVITFVPKLVIFLVILLVGWLIAKAVSKAVSLILDKVGFNHLIQRSGMGRFFSPSFGPAELIIKIVYYAILLIALQLALDAFGPNAISDLVNDIVAWLPDAVVAIIIIVIAAAIANAVREVVSGALGGLSYGGTLGKLAAAFVIALGVIAALNQIGIGTTVTLPVLVAVLGTIGGILVVGVGGGLIGPMRQRWEGWLHTMESDTAAAKEHYQAQRAAEDYQRDQGQQGGYDEGRYSGEDEYAAGSTGAHPYQQPPPEYDPHRPTGDQPPHIY